jgi:glycosyltransferase involved in cell wall biosynthesis
LRIAVNTRFLLRDKMEGFGWYTYEVTKRLVEAHPEHQFIFFFDRPYDERFVFGPNVEAVVLNPPARHPLLFIYWFEVAVKRALKKYKADVLFSPDGYLSLRSTVPQVGVIHDLSFEHYPKDIPFLARHYLRFFFPRFAKKAKHLITVSNASKEDIVNTYGIDSNKISVAYNGCSSEFKPVDSSTKQQCKEKYANGRPYFVFVGAIHPRKNVQRLLDAFALFKSHTKAETQLIIVGSAMWKKASYGITVPESVETEVHFTGHVALEELAKIMASADALTYVPYFEGFGIPLVEAMKCGTPIICGNRTSLPEVAGDAAILCDPFSVEEIAEAMERLTNDPILQQQLAHKGLERAALFSWDASAEHVWEVLKAAQY